MMYILCALRFVLHSTINLFPNYRVSHKFVLTFLKVKSDKNVLDYVVHADAGTMVPDTSAVRWLFWHACQQVPVFRPGRRSCFPASFRQRLHADARIRLFEVRVQDPEEILDWIHVSEVPQPSQLVPEH